MTTTPTETSATAASKPAKVPAQAATLTGKYYYGLGRRKRAIAQVRLYQDKGDHAGTAVVNTLPLAAYFDTKEEEMMALQPLVTALVEKNFFISAKVHGGGKKGQAAAVALGIARALIIYDETLKKNLKAAKLLTRDPREKERKKYGLRGARKARQYTKR
jgi:small subunit ribosomal protein S9